MYRKNHDNYDCFKKTNYYCFYPDEIRNQTITQGPTGPMGPQGEPGPTGATGSQGIQGIIGPTGGGNRYKW